MSMICSQEAGSIHHSRAGVLSDGQLNNYAPLDARDEPLVSATFPRFARPSYEQSLIEPLEVAHRASDALDCRSMPYLTGIPDARRRISRSRFRERSEGVTVHFVTANGTAEADPTMKGLRHVDFRANDVEKTFRFSILGDLLVEGDGLYGNARYPYECDDCAGDRHRDDQDNDPRWLVGDVSVTEGMAAWRNLRDFVVTLSAPSQQQITVKYATADGTAKVASGAAVITISSEHSRSLRPRRKSLFV